MDLNLNISHTVGCWEVLLTCRYTSKYRNSWVENVNLTFKVRCQRVSATWSTIRKKI